MSHTKDKLDISTENFLLFQRLCLETERKFTSWKVFATHIKERSCIHYMKRTLIYECQISHVQSLVGKMQIKNYSEVSENLKIKTIDIGSTDEGQKQLGVLIHYRWPCKRVQPSLRNILAIYYNVKDTYTMWHNNPTPS